MLAVTIEAAVDIKHHLHLIARAFFEMADITVDTGHHDGCGNLLLRFKQRIAHLAHVVGDHLIAHMADVLAGVGFGGFFGQAERKAIGIHFVERIFVPHKKPCAVLAQHGEQIKRAAVEGIHQIAGEKIIGHGDALGQAERQVEKLGIIGAGKNHQAVEVVAVAHAGGQAVDFFNNRRAFTLTEIFFQTADGFVDQIFQTDGVFFIVGVGTVGRQGEGNAGVGLQALDIFNGVQIHGFSLSCFTLRIIARIRRATA